MQTHELDAERLRRLAEHEGGQVLSVYLNLDPSEFATAEARSSAITSVVDEAERAARDDKHLRPAVARVREYLADADFDGAHGMAVFASEPDGLFEAFRLPRPVDNDVRIGPSAFVEPLSELAGGGDWFVLLANRRIARLFRGSDTQMRELGHIDSDTHGQHDQGGWSQARYQRSVDNEARDHIRRAVNELELRLRRAPSANVLLGAPDEVHGGLQRELSDAAGERLRGWVAVDVENSSSDDVLSAAQPLIEDYDRERESELLERVRQGVATGGRGAAGVADVLAALTEQRVEALLLDENFAQPGVRCTACGWLGPADVTECPADGGELERLDDVGEAAVERAVRQDAEVHVLRERPDLGPMEGIAAVLRF